MAPGVKIICGSITEFEGDAIVNSAHTSLLHGSGLCGSIHRAAGIELEKHCKQLGGCSVGSTVITPGFNLSARFVIHAVTPKLEVGEDLGASQERQWSSMEQSILDDVHARQIGSIAIPPLGTGGHNIPIDFVLPRLLEFAEDICGQSGALVCLYSTDSRHCLEWERLSKKVKK